MPNIRIESTKIPRLNLSQKQFLASPNGHPQDAPYGVFEIDPYSVSKNTTVRFCIVRGTIVAKFMSVILHI
jgi:hypothetical protein